LGPLRASRGCRWTLCALVEVAVGLLRERDVREELEAEEERDQDAPIAPHAAGCVIDVVGGEQEGAAVARLRTLHHRARSQLRIRALSEFVAHHEVKSELERAQPVVVVVEVIEVVVSIMSIIIIIILIMITTTTTIIIIMIINITFLLLLLL